MTVRTRPITTAASAGAEPSGDRAPFSWEDWFRHASASQRADALGLVQQQGLLYPNQVPAITNGVKPASAPVKETETSQLVTRLLAGKTDSLPRLACAEPTFFDADLDELQRQAVARAIATPDLLLLQGLPGTGKSRVLTEILLQAAARGWRVLFLAGHAASLDVILQRLVGRPEIFALRFLDTAEKPESLPAWLRGFTLPEQKQGFLERILTGARSKHVQAEAACKQRRDLEPIWDALQVNAGRQRDLDTRLQALRDTLPRIRATVERDAQADDASTSFRTRLGELTKSNDNAASEVEAALRTEQETLAVADREIAELAGHIAEREPAYLAKKHTRFWTLTFWLNLFNGAIIPEMEALVEQHARAGEAQQQIVQRIDEISERRQRLRQQFEQDRAALVAAEVEVREQALQAELHEAEEQRRGVQAEWTELCRQVDAHPEQPTAEAIAAAEQVWLAKKKHDEQQCQFAQQWTKFVEEAGTSLAGKLPGFANLLCGTVMRWHTDAKFRDAAAGPIDLVIVEDAETLTEADLTKLSRLSQRCVLVGQSLAEATAAPSVAEKASRALLPAPLVSAMCWSKLWHTLGGDAGCWPCSWRREQGRLVCQLVPLTADDARHLESEGLADAPDIELRILHRPRTQPCLAQVIFGPSCTFADAFAFMVREVQEFPLQPVGRTAWWSEDAQRHRRHLGPNAARIHAWLDIEPGLRLGTVADAQGEAVQIACIEFDKSAGWDRTRADAWLQRQRPVCDHERTVFLQTPYRFDRPLAGFVGRLVRTGDWLDALKDHDEASERTFEFVAVPPLVKHDWPREGAGLELDLSAARHADRLPVGLRQGLPARGFVNYLEAQALIRRLEAWQVKESATATRVAVLALYEGQVDLLRRLVEQSEILRARNFPLEIALPSRLHQRECDIVFLSLTRSHAHRCTAFGEDVKELPLALTRSRCRLLVFGDPGTLLKRTTWTGPLDHLDAAGAHQELVRLSRLVTCLQSSHVVPAANGQANGREP